MAQAIVNKLLHAPTVRLKEAAASGDSGLPGAAAALFGLEESEPTLPPRRGQGNGAAPQAAEPENAK
jgi:glutamyl-tRNA reductase